MEASFSAEERVLSAWSFEIFYGEFARRDWGFLGGEAIEIRGGALTHGRRLLGSKRVSDLMQAILVVGQGQVFIRQFPVPNHRSGCLG
jgi:hypothetical protein